MRSWKSISSLFACVLLVCAATSRADSTTVVYDSTGFEYSRFLTSFVNTNDPTVVGNLRGQDSGVQIWKQSGTAGGMAAGTATVQASIGYGGTQGVQVQRTTNDQFWYPILNITPDMGTSRFVQISWKMNVQQTTTNFSKYGPFFGIDANGNSGTTQRVGSFGMDATTGDLLYFDPTNGIQPVGTVVSFNQWHSYMLSLDYQTQTYAGYVDGVRIFDGAPFVNTLSNFTDADIVALQASVADWSNPDGSAVFDDYKVSTFVPEPGTGLALAGLVSVLALRRRRAN